MDDINQDLNAKFYKKLNQQIIQKDKLIKMLQKHIEQLKEALASGGGFSPEEKEELEKKVEDLSRENEDLKNYVAELEEKLKRIDELELENQNLKLQLEKEEPKSSEEDLRKIEFLSKQLSEKENEINVFIQKVEELERQNEKLQEEKLQLEGEVEKLKKHVEELENEKAEGNIQEEEKEAIAREYQDKIASLEKEISRLVSEKELLESELKGWEARYQELEKKLEELSKSSPASEKIEEEISTLKSQLETLKSENKSLLEEKNRLQEELEKLQKDSSKEIDISKLEAEKEELLKEKENLLAEIENLKTKVEEQSRILKQYEKEKEELLQQVKAKVEVDLSGEKMDISSLLPVLDKVAKKYAEEEVIWEFLKTFGIEKINTVGEEYNPDFCEVVEYVTYEGLEDNQIVEEIEAGFLYQGKVLKKAKVKCVRNSYFCPECNNKVASDDRFCSKCGAKLDFSSSISKEPEVEELYRIFLSLAKKYYERGDLELALEQLQKAREYKEDGEELLEWEGKIWEKKGEFERAFLIYDKLYNKYPTPENETRLKLIKAKLEVMKNLQKLDIE